MKALIPLHIPTKEIEAYQVYNLFITGTFSLKSHLSLLVVYFILFFFYFIVGQSPLHAQNLEFSYVVANNGTTSTVTIAVNNTVAGTENLAGYTLVLYYNTLESTFASFDDSPTAALGWNTFSGSTVANTNINNLIPIVHRAYTEINIIDQDLAGTNIGQLSQTLITLTYDNTIGTSAGSEFYLASTTDGHPALAYTNASFTGFPVNVDQSGSLPVEYLEFTAEALPNFKSQLKWTTSLEINNSGFVIERAHADDLIWQSIGFVEGNGTTSAASDYEFIDPAPFTGENLYRLRQRDIDGSESLSQIRTLRFDASQEMSIYPVPAKEEVNVRLLDSQIPEGEVSYTMYDFNGRQVMNGEWKESMIHAIDIEDLPAGTYHLKVFNGQQVFQKQLIKIH
ncbi:MAG: T9SS type A sorting domain-containing protein [Bacteroidota bacterium]